VNRFQGKVAVVTGAGTGIGLEIVEALLKEGASVIANDIDQTSLYDLTNKHRGGKLLTVGADAALPETGYLLVEKAVSNFGRLDIVVANAGITSFGKFLEYTPSEFRSVLDLNLQGTFFLAQAGSKQMVQQGEGGKILLTSSVIGIQAAPQLTAYAMTKAALSMMARNLVAELSPHKINMNCIAPGATLTPRTKLESSDYEGEWSQIVPLGRVASTKDIADSALFLVSDQARHISGQTLVVDGGWTCISPFPANDA